MTAFSVIFQIPFQFLKIFSVFTKTPFHPRSTQTKGMFSRLQEQFGSKNESAESQLKCVLQLHAENLAVSASCTTGSIRITTQKDLVFGAVERTKQCGLRCLTPQEFLDGCTRLKGSARSMDVHAVLADPSRAWCARICTMGFVLRKSAENRLSWPKQVQ